MKFKFFAYLLIPKLTVDLISLLYLSPLVAYLLIIVKNINFTTLGIIHFIFTALAYLGFIFYGKLFKDSRFKLLIFLTILIFLAKTILIIITQYRFFYFLLSFNIIASLILFVSFWFIKDTNCKEAFKLAIYFRNSAIVGFIMLTGHRLMVFNYLTGKLIFIAGTFLQVIILILMFYQSWKLFIRLSEVYK
jgi:hypothetical protein